MTVLLAFGAYRQIKVCIGFGRFFSIGELTEEYPAVHIHRSLINAQAALGIVGNSVCGFGNIFFLVNAAQLFKLGNINIFASACFSNLPANTCCNYRVARKYIALKQQSVILYHSKPLTFPPFEVRIIKQSKCCLIRDDLAEIIAYNAAVGVMCG